MPGALSPITLAANLFVTIATAAAELKAGPSTVVCMVGVIPFVDGGSHCIVSMVFITGLLIAQHRLGPHNDASSQRRISAVR